MSDSSRQTITEEDIDNLTMLPTPRIYPHMICWEQDNELLFTISLHSGGDVTTELHRMTCDEVERFIMDVEEQLELFKEHYDSSHTTKSEKDE